MALSLIATDAFERDYDEALAYLTYRLGAPHAARRLMDAMDASIAKICASPDINAVSRKPTLAKLQYREELVDGYVLLYRIEGDVIIAKRLFHQSQDYESYL